MASVLSFCLSVSVSLSGQGVAGCELKDPGFYIGQGHKHGLQTRTPALIKGAYRSNQSMCLSLHVIPPPFHSL